MNRYQIYLEPRTVRTYDSVSEELRLTRSAIMRDVLDRVAREYRKVITGAKSMSLKSHPLIKMAGMFKSPTGHISENIDEIYSRD
ncbi:hypothetical protein A3D00_04870 [Candidatus Woesebacteria bacterium RIFCSPHIGHO2_02_FULL_38_9]|uniref:Ribbon-helix-helix protein CopG domain-containing protein n=1 Tax=Candidatus Woesebacteria bacterium RIFCSPHIGHO2_01_FULL_39_28 TaxID=1802496 RepID=A0A1F7YAQ6_9BACT|nr:MAG: hypothetical protein A2627_03995 [Candidatus Woesebacteria bacterium RIFCSPHIGHO2_01_FULL_39_28]OGM32918.1 MAG: hypothetical protein A3D00_04870 [Candidatus Woesebacteria bacterium RIFCSPHIGHO2_02_FULL_38_9]